MAVPVYIITCLILLTLVLVVFYFQDVRDAKGKLTLNIFSAFSKLAAAVKFKPIRNISIVFFLCVLSLTLFYIYCIVYLFNKFQFTTFENSVAMLMMVMVMVIAMAITSRFLIKPLQERFSLTRIVSAALILMAGFQALFLLSDNGYFAVICILPLFMANGVAYTNCLDIFSASVPENRQGWVMGISISLLTLGGGIASIIGEKMMSLLLQLPFLVSILTLVIAALLAIALKILNPYMEQKETAGA